MKSVFVLLFAIQIMLAASCIEKGKSDDPNPGKGFVSGKVLDTYGKPLANAEIVVNNSQFYNSNILGKTDADGNYKLQVSPGSWYVRGTTTVMFDHKKYVLDLHPETDEAFGGTEGAVRNLHWKISGQKTGEFGMAGYYGGIVEILGYNGFFDADRVELTLEPVGTLIDGSTGKTITRNPEGDVLNDVPLGKYKITARYNNQSMRIRIRNKGQAFAASATDSFDPAYPGAAGSYKITVEVELPE